MEKRQAKLLILIFFMFAFAACGNPQEEARIKLGQMNVKYNEDSFVDAARNGDILAARLFLQSGMKPNITDKKGEPPLIAAVKSGRP
ncbi:MAG: ankyrin repeat domain-containing protein, partial [Proteobacteria bacterium]|nr:ankyrin repeat domain-containing protein [Pseudomonadota bacterium]